MLTVFLYLVVFPIFAFSQFLSYDAIRMRVPGRCMMGDYDCGLGQCVPISQFRDGKPDCMDGSDEWCFIGQVSCGPVYCADYKDALSCIVYPKCDGSAKQLPWCSASKEKLCADKTSFPCKGYGECVLWEWLLDGKKDCIDGSDEDENYVMPLEHAYRCARNQSGIYLTKPVPPPPEDHPSLYVEGCSMCPNSKKPELVSIPTDSAPSDGTIGHTTPKYPFITSGYQGSSSITPFNPSEETSNTGEFFPQPQAPFEAEISRVTTSQKPNEPIGDFFPTFSTATVPPFTEASTQSHTFRLITIPSISQTQFPQAPLIFPGRPDLPPITAPSPLNNWPIPIATTTPESHQPSTFPPITYPASQEVHGQIPPIRPEIVISRPVTPTKPDSPSEYRLGGSAPGINPYEIPETPMRPQEVFPNSEAGYRPVTEPGDETGGVSEIGIFPKLPNNGHKVIDTLIPLHPGQSLPELPTRRPITIPSFFTTSTSRPLTPPHENFVPFTPPPLDKKVNPTLIPQSEIEKYVQTKVPPSSSIFEVPETDFTTYTTKKPSEGFIEEKTSKTPPRHNNATLPTDMHHVPETTTSKTTSQSKIIHVGPHGVIEDVDKNDYDSGDSRKESEATGGNISNPGSGQVIHIGPTVPTDHSTHSTSSSSTATEPSPTSIETTSHSIESTTTVKTGDPKIDECLDRMSSSEPSSSVVCDCPNGQFRRTGNGQCEEVLSLMNVKINVNTICNTDKSSFEQKQRVLYQKIGQLYKSCIRPNEYGSSLVATIKCDECSVEEINRVLTTRSFGEPGILNVTAEAINGDLCSNSDFNHCHVYSDCTVDSEGLRYACRCKKGTSDTSGGYGRQCDGFPEESDCIMVLGICLIVWLMFLLGSFMLSLLACILCYSLCRKRCCRQIAIHPADANGLQTVVIGPKAAKSLEANGDRDKMPHMKAIFAESLKHSAKGSSSVASAFALADFRRKRVSRPPDMSKVIEEVNETPSASGPVSETLPKVSSLAKISTNSEPPTPVGVIETPILEKNSSSVSLVSANDNAPQLPSLPLPLPVPITASTSTTNLEETMGDEKREGAIPSHEQQVPEAERPASSHSIGVQPTIWETYRVLGQQYSKSDLTERKPSVDSLEQMFEARLAETSRTTKTIPTVRTEKSENSAITFTANPHKEDTEKPSAPTDDVRIPVHPKPDIDKPPVDDPSEIEHNVEEANEKKLEETDSKLADMIGVTSFHSPSRPGSNDGKSKDVIPETADNLSGDLSPSLEKSLEAALLIEMAKRGIELPLSPKTPVPTNGEFEKVTASQSRPVETIETTEDSDVKPVKPESKTPQKDESRKSSAKSIASLKKTKIPSASQSRASSSKLRTAQIDEQDNEPEVFVPQGAKPIQEKKRTLRRSGGSELVPSTDESDPEVVFFKRLEKMKRESDRYPVHPYRKYSRRRRPERTLSSISEKSAEIAAEAALEYPADTSISCPPTTRAFLEPRAPPVPRYVFRRKVIEATDETSDVDLPKLSPAKNVHPVVSSPEIPDVTLQRSMENLHKFDKEIKQQPPPMQSRTPTKKSSLAKKKPIKNGTTHPSSSLQSSRHSSKFGSMATTPRNGDDTPTSHTSRSTRHSVISRKIAIRRHELKAVSGSAHDLASFRSKKLIPSQTIRGAKSVGDLSKRQPHWDISPYRDQPGPSTFLPPITPSRHVRTAANSPQPRHRRSDSHFSMTSLPLIAHSPTSFWSSPHFNPSEDSRKPPKEDLWWNPNKRN